MSNTIITSTIEEEQERLLSLQNVNKSWEEYLFDEKEDLYQGFIKKN